MRIASYRDNKVFRVWGLKNKSGSAVWAGIWVVQCKGCDRAQNLIAWKRKALVLNIDSFSLIRERTIIKVLDTINEPIFLVWRKNRCLISTNVDNNWDKIRLLSSWSCFEAVNLIYYWQDWVYYDVIRAQLQDWTLFGRGCQFARLTSHNFVKDNFLTFCIIWASNIEPVGVSALRNGLAACTQVEMMVCLICSDGLNSDIFPSANSHSDL